MCELLGMDCNVPTDIVFSFRGFAKRGGETGPHSDGWGVCLYDGRGVRSFREPHPAAQSPLARYLRENSIKTKIGVAHIRRKTKGKVQLSNTHPFTRELWGRTWSFAHNGKVHAVTHRSLSRFQPVGTTDSEHAFCWMMDAIAAKFPSYPSDPKKLWAFVAQLGADIGRYGNFNFLLSDSTYLFARCHTNLHHLVRKHPFARATLADEDVTINFADHTTPKDRVAVIATYPLTRDEAWVKGVPGTLWIFSAGNLKATLPSSHDTYKERKNEWRPSTSNVRTTSAKTKRGRSRKPLPTVSKRSSTSSTAGTATR